MGYHTAAEIPNYCSAFEASRTGTVRSLKAQRKQLEYIRFQQTCFRRCWTWDFLAALAGQGTASIAPTLRT